MSLVLLGMQSCKTTSGQTNTTAKKVSTTAKIDGFWILKSLNNQASKDIFQGELPTMTIDLANRSIYGYSGCNRYTGSFNYENGTFTAPNLASTRMMCMSDNQEAQFLAMLGQPSTVSIENGILTFKNNGRVVAEFTEGIDKAFLEGKWVLESMQGQDLNILFLTSENIPTLKFNTDEGKVNGNAGCNNYSAGYTVTEQFITLGPIMSTKMACPNLQGEDIFTNMLSGTSKLQTTEDKLTFSKDGVTTLQFKKIKE